MEAILAFFNTRMEIPQSYGAFHLLCCVVVICLTVFFAIKFKDCDDRTFRKIVLITWIILLLFEAYKQIVFTFSVTDNGIQADFQWYAFPFQFCSTPYVLFPIIAFAKDGTFRNSAILFIATFSLFAGLAVYSIPVTVFCSIAGINIQTMVHHGSQIVIGILAAVYGRKFFNFIQYLGSMAIFCGLCVIATVLNETYFYYISQTETFNMFFISRHFPCTLILLDQIYAKVPFPVFFSIYICGFAALGLGMYSIEKLCYRLNSIKRKNKPIRKIL